VMQPIRNASEKCPKFIEGKDILERLSKIM
jgi:hypothetical protein